MPRKARVIVPNMPHHIVPRGHNRNAVFMERRAGSLWDSRYKISPIQSDEYLLQCCRYVELNPVKAKMVESAELYP